MSFRVFSVVKGLQRRLLFLRGVRTAGMTWSACRGSSSIRMMNTSTGLPQGQGTDSPQSPIVEVKPENFSDIVLKSKTPVILDVYADWCGPCKQLTPVLEDAARRSGNRLLLAKLNSDQHPELAQNLQVTSLPSVFGFFGGKLVDSFVGLPQPDRLQSFFSKLLQAAQGVAPAPGSPEDMAKAAEEFLQMAVQRLNAKDTLHATQMFERVLEEIGEDATDTALIQARARALAGIARAAIMDGDLEIAEEFVQRLDDKYYAPAQQLTDIRQARAAFELAQSQQASASAGSEDGEGESMEDLLVKAEKDPNDAATLFQVAQLYSQKGQYEDAIEYCLKSIKADRSHEEGAARELLLKMFEALGESHPATAAGRKKLASVLFS